MIAAVVIGCYAVAWLVTARLAFYAIRSDDTMAPDDGFEAVMMGLLSVIAGAFWPLALPVALVMWHPRKTPAELQEQIRARDRRIAELEREAGITRT